ncbi:hypothetical protein CCACVL1_07010 [Corchorus capsularis]|uniref:Uncharacterized protein n=1 Tax=Corchorus capsularis TaxID=210143 RepID=A0A1R3JAG9_COCAP|nr:hypothetical protein CCACVL1_07010 [Corchorus capsularis]
MAEYITYKRRRKRAKTVSALEGEESMKEQCCLIPGTPTKPPPGRPQTRKEKNFIGLNLTLTSSCSSEFSIDLNKPACGGEDNAEVHEIESTCLVSGVAIEGLDIFKSGELNKIDDRNPVSSLVPSMEFIDYGEPKSSQASADTKESESDHSEKLSSNLNFVQDEVMQVNCEEIHTKEPDHSEKLSSKPNFVQDDELQENPEEIQVKTPKKPKSKRYTTKVVIDDKLAPKPPPKKLPKSKEKKPRSCKTPKQKPQIPTTPKQPKEKKRKPSTSKKTKLDFQSQHLEEANLPVLEEANLPDLESQSQHSEAKDIQSQHFPVKPNIKGQRFQSM